VQAGGLARFARSWGLPPPSPCGAHIYRARADHRPARALLHCVAAERPAVAAAPRVGSGRQARGSWHRRRAASIVGGAIACRRITGQTFCSWQTATRPASAGLQPKKSYSPFLACKVSVPRGVPSGHPRPAWPSRTSFSPGAFRNRNGHGGACRRALYRAHYFGPLPLSGPK